MQQICHDGVARAYYVGNGAHAVADQILRVAVPHIRTVRQAGYLYQVTKAFGLRLNKHVAHEAGAQLRNAECTRLATYLLRGNAQCLGRDKKRYHLFIVHRHIGHFDTRHVLQIFVHGGHVVAQLVQL